MRMTLLLLIVMTFRAPGLPAQSADEPLVFLDSKAFDRTLGEALRADPGSVLVEFVDPPSPNDLPERFASWLAAVEKRGGSISTEPTERTRGAEFGVVELGVEAVQAIRKKRLFNAVKGYDVVVYYNAETGEVERAEFVRRENEP